VSADGTVVVRLAQLRGRIASFARGGRYDLAIDLLGELARVDLALGLPADGIQRARQAAQLAEERGESTAGPLLVLAATLLATRAPEAAIDACAAAIARAESSERARVEAIARLVGGAAQRAAGRFAEARVLLDAARGAAARLGETGLAGLALAELAWIDLAENRPASAATCFEFAGEFFARGSGAAVRIAPGAALEAEALAVACWAADRDAAREAVAARAAKTAAKARAADRPELAAYVDSVLADLAIARRAADSAQASARAAASADGLREALGRELAARARLRQVRTADDARDRARHLEAGIELALALDRTRAGAQLGTLLADLVEDTDRPPTKAELARLANAIAGLGDPSLADLASAVLDELESG